MDDSRLFQPITVGTMQLKHRIGMAPLTRYRASDGHVPTQIMAEYYAQRASTPGTLIISEATFISASHGGFDNAPGIYSDDQVKGWRAVTDAVHARGCYIYCQLWGLGRAANPQTAAREGLTVTSSSGMSLGEGHAVPVPLTVAQIKQTVQDFAAAARNALRAGFDGVEIHGANGYLIDQFIQDTCNNRTDDYGGSVQNRSRFALEVVDAVCAAVGAERTAIRFSPWSTFQGMRMADPIPQFSDIIRRISHHKLAYLHLIEARISASWDIEPAGTLDFAYDLWDGPLLIAGGYKPDTAKRLVDEDRPGRSIVVVFGRYFVSTPDLAFRVKEGLGLTPYSRDNFFTPKLTEGYTTYPYSKEFLESTKVAA